MAGGAVELHRELSPGRALAAADLALARAENDRPFAVELADDIGGPLAEGGSRAWAAQLRSVLGARAAELGSFRVVDGRGRTIHLESPLRLRLAPGGTPVVAAHWLPLALRSRLTAEIDELAVSLAIEAIARDGQARAVNLAPASLRQSGFAARLVRRIGAAPAQAARLWLELHEDAAAEQIDALCELGRQLKPLGVRLGLEHAGERLARIERLFDAGLDYVKLDASVGRGVAGDAARTEFVAGLVRLLHGLSMLAMVEGVVEAADAEVLLRAGVDGLTGPWAERNPAAAPVDPT